MQNEKSVFSPCVKLAIIAGLGKLQNILDVDPPVSIGERCLRGLRCQFQSKTCYKPLEAELQTNTYMVVSGKPKSMIQRNP